MIEVLWTALGVGGATVIGAVIGFLFKKVSHKFNDVIMAFAAGIMMAAAVIGLILPSLEYGKQYGGDWSVVVTVVGVFAGAMCVTLIDKIVPHLHKMSGVDSEAHPEKTEKLNKVLLFVMAIAIHNLPEGIAAGVGFGTEDTGAALTIAIGIALQNIPEGMVIIAPMLAAGMTKGRAFMAALLTGFVEVIGTLFGYLAVSISTVILPFALAFAGGTMLYVISDEMILETHAHGSERPATYALLIGFCLMLVMSYFLG